MKLVPNKEIREAYLRSGLSLQQLANFCDLLRPNGEPDTTKLSRSLGISKSWNNRRCKYYKSEQMGEDKALKIIKGLNLDPVDFRDIGL